MESSRNTCGSKPYDMFFLSDKVMETIDRFETRILAARKQHGTGGTGITMRTYSAPLRFDTRVRLHQNHALGATPLVALHERHRKMGIKQTSLLEGVEHYYRVRLRSGGLWPIKEYGSPCIWEEGPIAPVFMIMMEEFRSRLFRQGTE